MRHSVILAMVFAACGGPGKRPPEPISNSGSSPAPIEPTSPGLVGVLTDDLGEPLMGATVVVSDSEILAGEVVEITDEHGKFTMANIPSGRFMMTIYYNDLTTRRAIAVDGPTKIEQQVRIQGRGGDIYECIAPTASSCHQVPQ
jgi:hypothetical protein